MSEELKKKEEEIKELTDLLKRVQANFENYKKRTEKSEENYVRMGKVLVLRKILPVLDSFENAKQEEAVKPLYNQLISSLKNLGLEPIQAEGKFDPNIHDCICRNCSDKPKGEIVEEVSKGYKLDSIIIRHPKVIVSEGNDNNNKNTKEKSD